MANGDPGTSTLPDTLGTLPERVKSFVTPASVEARGAAARRELPALMKEKREAAAEQERLEFQRDQDTIRKTAEAERNVARGTRMETEKLETGLQQRGVFEAPEYKASNYAANSATRLLTAVLLGGVAKTSARGQLEAIKAMQDAEERGLSDQFEAARLRFDEQEKQRQDNNKMLKDRFDRMIDLLGKDRNAALVEAKLIEGQVGEGIIAQKLRAGLLTDAYDTVVKAIDADNRVALERVKGEGRGAGGRPGQLALNFASRVYGNIRNSFTDVKNLQTLPAVSESPALAGMINRDPETAFSSISALTARTITSAEKRAFDQVTNSLSRALSMLESQGLASGGTKAGIAAFDAVRPRSGDNAVNMALYIARVKQEIETGVDVHDKMPGATPEQKAAAQAMLRELDKVIPFDVDDVMRAIGKNRETISDKMNDLLKSPSIVDVIIKDNVIVGEDGKTYILNPKTGKYREAFSGRP